VNHLKEWQCLPDLVRLEVPDQMPPQLCRQVRNLRLRLLHSVLTKEQLTRVDSLSDYLRRMSFTDGYQFNTSSKPPRSPYRFGDICSNRFKIFRNVALHRLTH
jgi:hypothetical protein